MDHEKHITFSGANCTHFEHSFNSTEPVEPDEIKRYIILPSALTELTNGSVAIVIAYCIAFLIAAGGNFRVLLSLWVQYKRNNSRISLLLLHLSLADLIVCCILIPTEILWRLTIQWHGGNILCKLVQYLGAFGLYLSSLVLICVTVDRFLAIVFPLNVIKIKAAGRNKCLLTGAWISAAVFSVPQAIFFGVESHPEYPSFTQCVTNNFLNDPSDVKIYSIFSVAVMYFLPLTVILCTYSAITVKLYRVSGQSRYVSVRVSKLQSTGSVLSRKGRVRKFTMELRCSSNVGVIMSNAKKRTLLMTVTIICTFVFCWTPYSAMTLWYMVDWKGASGVDRTLQDGLFFMAVTNSCINPFIYRVFMHKRGKHKLCCLIV